MKTITLLVIGINILNAGAFLDHGDVLEAEGDAIYPKHTIEGYSLVDVEVEDDFNYHLYSWENNALTVKAPPAPSKQELQEQADAIQVHIDTLEKESILNRGSRELELLLMEDRAATIAYSKGTTQAAVLESIIYYVKLKALDTKIANLRAEMAILWTQLNT